VRLRQEKVDKIAYSIPDQKIDNGPHKGDVLVLGWGSTYGVIKTTVEQLLKEGHSVAHAHLRYLRPFPKNLGEIVSNFKTVLIPEINNGQLVKIIRDKYLVDAKAYNKIMGIPITKSELVEAIKDLL
jgi:2-oxoglutarate/2-oxoacid ferredoxin oxidoreductase subunit alpha